MGTGGASDIVTLGGTGSLGPNASVSGGQLEIQDNNTGIGYVTLTPSSAANAFDSWYTEDGIGPGLDELNGAFDFFFTTDSNTDTQRNSYRFLDFYFGPSNDFRLAVTNNSSTSINFQILDYSSGSGSYINYPSTSITYTPGTTYHVAYAIETNGSGEVIGKLYLLEGANSTIDSSTPISTSNLGVTIDINTDEDTDYGFRLGLLQDETDQKTVSFDSFRIYDSVPTEFPGIPEPQSVALALGGISLLAVFGWRRAARK
ncbi:hypothetical protein [Cerasicoccus frondis]|uniref:hypothetical protein n=1 Tax=Cerasicoccus frondis TaxID=490090 RepID=UPI0028525F5B|nr:hypothetical protein [Cerasicoccus frondis]